MDAVGVAHNAALARYRERLRNGRAAKDRCLDLVDNLPAMIDLPEGQRADVRQLRAVMIAGLSRGPCASRFPVSIPSQLLKLTAMQSGPGKAVPLSDDALALLGDVSSLSTSGLPPDDLASSLLPILSSADALQPAEADIVYAVSSVAQSSTEYWYDQINSGSLETQAQEMANENAPCFDQVTTEDEALATCLGLSPGSTEGAAMRSPSSSRPLFRFASVAAGGCNQHISMVEVVHMDVTGGLMGAFAGALAGGIGAFPGALGGAAAGSSSEMVWQLGKAAWCEYNQQRGR